MGTTTPNKHEFAWISLREPHLEMDISILVRLAWHLRWQKNSWATKPEVTCCVLVVRRVRAGLPFVANQHRRNCTPKPDHRLLDNQLWLPLTSFMKTCSVLNIFMGSATWRAPRLSARSSSRRLMQRGFLTSTAAGGTYSTVDVDGGPARY